MQPLTPSVFFTLGKLNRRIKVLLLAALLINLPNSGFAGIIPGDLIITEVMANPANVSDSNGEWFEIYNASSDSVGLNGLQIRDNGANSHILNSASPLLLEPGEYFVLGREVDSSKNGGYTPDYHYNGFALSNSSDEIILQLGTTIIDSLLYNDRNIFGVAGHSASFFEGLFTLTPNHFSYGLGDIGTPGSETFPMTSAVTSVPAPSSLPLLACGLLLARHVFSRMNKRRMDAPSQQKHCLA